MHKDGYLKKLENVCHVGKSPQYSFFSNAGALVVLTAMWWNSFTPSTPLFSHKAHKVI